MEAALPEDLISDILLRVPPDEPACLVRASTVCKDWRRILADPGFLDRYRALHRTAPVLGFLHNPIFDHEAPRFVPTTSFRLPDAAADRHMRHVWDCRHGRVLLYHYDSSPTTGFVVWDPIADDQQTIGPEVGNIYTTNGAVVCTAGGGCDHRSCSGGPFMVAFIGLHMALGMAAWHAMFYSSMTRNWRFMDITNVGYKLKVDRSAALVEDSLYFVGSSGFLLRCWYGPLLQLDYTDMVMSGICQRDIMTVIEQPNTKHLGEVVVMTAEDGGLGLASLYGNKISLWARETGKDGDGGWVKRKTIDLKTLLPLFNPKRRACLSGMIPEGANTIFVSTEDGVFRIELEPLQARKVSEVYTDIEIIYPFVSFYTETLLQRLASSKVPAPVVESVIFNEALDDAYPKEQ